MPFCFEEKNILRTSIESLSSGVGKQQFPNKYFNCIHKNETLHVLTHLSFQVLMSNEHLYQRESSTEVNHWANIQEQAQNFIFKPNNLH